MSLSFKNSLNEFLFKIETELSTISETTLDFTSVILYYTFMRNDNLSNDALKKSKQMHLSSEHESSLSSLTNAKIMYVPIYGHVDKNTD